MRAFIYYIQFALVPFIFAIQFMSYLIEDIAYSWQDSIDDINAGIKQHKRAYNRK